MTLPKTTTAAKTSTAAKKSSPSNSLATPALAKAAPPRVPTPTTNPSALEKEALKTFYDVIREEFPSITIQGWRVEIRERKTGNSQGTTDKYYFPPPLSKSAPPGMEDLPKRFRSMNEVMPYVKVRYLGAGVDIVKRGKKGAKAPSARAPRLRLPRPPPAPRGPRAARARRRPRRSARGSRAAALRPPPRRLTRTRTRTTSPRLIPTRVPIPTTRTPTRRTSPSPSPSPTRRRTTTTSPSRAR